jgi:hypothetical protein
MAFAKILTIYQILEFTLSSFSLITPHPIPGIVSTGLFSPFTNMCT